MSGARFFQQASHVGRLFGMISRSSWYRRGFLLQPRIRDERSTMILNTFVVGMLVLGPAQLEYVALRKLKSR